jgi:hypothetical protein
MKRLVRFFDRLEDKIRIRLSHTPIFYAIIGGVAIVLFWRGVWETADMLEHSGIRIFEILFYGPISGIWSSVVMLLTGLFVSFFIGDRIILTGIKREKKLEEKTEAEVKQESEMVNKMFIRLGNIERKLGMVDEDSKADDTSSSNTQSNNSEIAKDKSNSL